MKWAFFNAFNMNANNSPSKISYLFEQLPIAFQVYFTCLQPLFLFAQDALQTLLDICTVTLCGFKQLVSSSLLFAGIFKKIASVCLYHSISTKSLFSQNSG